MKTRFSIAVLAMLLIITSCTPELSEAEQRVISNDLANNLYQQEIDEIGSNLSEYIVDAISDYSESLGNQLQHEIDERNAANAFFGGSMFDIAELFGTTTNDLITKKYYAYIDYVNRHLEDVTDMATGMTSVLGKHPEFINQFHSELPETISLEIFSQLSGVPSTVSASSMDFGSLSLNDTDKESWGGLLMGEYKKPQISVPAVLYLSILAVDGVVKPKPVYAIYDEDLESWEVGSYSDYIT